LEAKNLAMYVGIHNFHYKYGKYNNVAAKRDDILMRNVILTSKHVKRYAVHSRLAVIHQLLGKPFYTFKKKRVQRMVRTLLEFVRGTNNSSP
jgi:hypothetical protein